MGAREEINSSMVILKAMNLGGKGEMGCPMKKHTHILWGACLQE